MASFTLTTGPDTIVGGDSDDTVNGTAATLNAGDQLYGGAGIDELALYGSGTYHVDQLAVFTGFESITLSNFTSANAALYLGSQSIAVTAYGAGPGDFALGSGAITFLGGYSNTLYVTSPLHWNAGNAIDGGSLRINSDHSDNESYDLTANTLTRIDYLYGHGSNLTLTINNANAAGISHFYGANGEYHQLVTSDATLDLSHSTVSGFTVTSTNATGTTFTVQDIGTAFQIAGGAGQDTIAALGFTFTPDQRNAIFTTASIEQIVDASGTYTASPPNPNVFTLTTGPDTIVGGDSDDTVNGTAATLNAGDQLYGGAGIDELALYGSGAYHVDQLAVFTGFESITLSNFTSANAALYLGSQSIAVTAYGSGPGDFALGSGAITFLGGYSNTLYVTSPLHWNAGNAIDGGSLRINSDHSDNESYDLTANTLTRIDYLYGHGSNLTLTINNANAAGISHFYGANGEYHQLVTSDATLDLSHSTVSGFTVTSTNATGTTFTVQDIGTAFQIAGGAGQDTIAALGFTFTPDQRDAIFATNSIESIQDQSGTYFSNGGVNTAPTLALDNEVTTLSEATNATNRVKVADITITDDGEGTNQLTLSGADAALFEVFDGDLYLKAGTVLDFEGGNTTLDVTVEVDDPAIAGSPDDSAALSISVTDVSETITNGNAAGTVAGTTGNDVIDAQGGNDIVNAGDGNDTITGGTGRDTVNAGSGDDTIVAIVNDGSLDAYNGGAGTDTLDMSAITAPVTINLALYFASSSQTGLDALTQIENVIGGSGNDKITGNGAANQLDGGGGNDTINAGAGNDIVIGGTGDDTMNGGVGSDIFVFAAGFGNDMILQFDANPARGQDLLDISAFGITGATFAARVTIADVGANTLITIDGNAAQTIHLVGIGNTATVTQADFVLV